MNQSPGSLEEVRGFYAKRMAAASGSSDPRLERIFDLVPREAFVPRGPWQVMVGDRYVETPSADPRYLYQNMLVALDAEKRINNGEPFLHAAWIGAVAPQPGEIVTHIGAGTGYYSAILSMLVRAGGHVTAFEIEPRLAEAARHNLEPFDNVSVVAGDAVLPPLPASDLIYVNAGVAAPPLPWLEALRPEGRLIFPWRPSKKVGIAVLVTRRSSGFELRPLMPSWFIPCVGASEVAGPQSFRPAAAWQSRSIRMAAEQAADETATAVYPDLWFSTAPLPI
jgi:protein-L-isoaspartate(D-aspartate) O-methyltransferase